MTITLLLSPSVAEELLEILAEEAPAERCGFLMGRRIDDCHLVERLRRARNCLSAPGHFAIAQDELDQVLRPKSTVDQAIGVYHTHDDGFMDMSPTDERSARRYPLVWLIIGRVGDLSSGRRVCLCAFVWTQNELGEVPVLCAPTEFCDL